MSEQSKLTPDLITDPALLQQLADSFPDGLLIFEADGTISYLNAVAAALLGRPPSEVVGEALLTAFEELLLRVNQTDQLRTLLSQNEPSSRAELALVMLKSTETAQGVIIENRNLHLTQFSLGTSNSRALIMRDTTNEQMADQLKNEFVAVVSHELRTPLSAMQGFSELLLTQDATPERRKLWLEMINRETVRLNGLIEDMLSLSRIESGRIDVRVERVELEPAIRHCVEILRVGTSRHNFKIEVENNLPAANADRDKFIQILNNLIGNAIKYSTKGGQITIKAAYLAEDNNQLQISVRDQGVGIPPEEVGRIFDKFYRVQNNEVREVKGVGLGLAITRNLVELMGGRIWVESEVGVGTTFNFTLPVHSFPAREVKAFRDILVKTVLVPDKDTTEAELYLDYLQRTLPSNQLDEVLRDTLYEVGELWQSGQIGVGEEHLATGIVRDFLSRSRPLPTTLNGYRLVIGGVAGEEHSVGITMVANAFSRAGWSVTNLGANVPIAAFITTIEQSEAHMLLLSISLSQRLTEIKRVVQQVREAFPDLVIGIGGRLLNELPDLSSRLGADFHASTPEDALRIAQQTFSPSAS